MTRNGTYEGLGGFLDENDVEIEMSFKNCFDDEIVFLNVLWKDF